MSGHAGAAANEPSRNEPPTDTLLPVAAPDEVRAALAVLVRPQRRRLLAAAVALVAATVAALLAPPLLGAVVDVAVSGRPASDVTAPVLGLLAVALATGVLDAVGRALLARAGEPVLADLREQVVDRALAVPPDHVERAGTGDLLARVGGDVEAVSQLFGSSLSALVRSGLTIGLTVVGLAFLDWRLALAGLLAVPLQLLAVRRYLRVAAPTYAEERKKEGARAQQLLASIEGAATVRAYRRSDEHVERVARRSREAADVGLRAVRMQTRFFGMLNGAELIGTSTVLVTGFLLVRADALSVGAATAAALYFIRLFDPINVFLYLIDDAQQASAALGRLVGVTQLPDPPRGTRTPSAADVDVRRVRHAYTPGREVLGGIDLTLREGEPVALVGVSGAGKTTLAALIAGMRSPTAGEIRVGGVPVPDLANRPDHVPVMLVTQEGHTFAGTLAEDMRLARPSADDAITAALDRVGALEWARALPDGLDTVVGAGGHRLTAAQGQQLALARLVLADPPVAVLDEATAEAGSAGARLLEAAADRALAGRTALVVAHRLTQAEAADRVVVLDAGRIVEIGTHAQLLGAGSPYARLWSAWARARQ